MSALPRKNRMGPLASAHSLDCASLCSLWTASRQSREPFRLAPRIVTRMLLPLVRARAVLPIAARSLPSTESDAPSRGTLLHAARCRRDGPAECQVTRRANLTVRASLFGTGVQALACGGQDLHKRPRYFAVSPCPPFLGVIQCGLSE